MLLFLLFLALFFMIFAHADDPRTLQMRSSLIAMLECKHISDFLLLRISIISILYFMISQFKLDAFMLSTRPLPVNRVHPRARYNLCETTDVFADPRVCILARTEGDRD